MIVKKAEDGSYLVPLKEVRKYDVIVVGAGPAGSVAAVSAARNGASTLLIERHATLGGLMTIGGVSGIPINGYLFNDANERTGGPRPFVVEGVSLELYRRLQDAGGALPGKPQGHGPMDSMILAHVLDDMVTEAGVTVLFNTVVFDAVVEDGKVIGVAVANKSGGQTYFADVVIDCSADGDVAAAAGCAFDFGRPSDGRRHGGSIFFHIGGIDVDRLVDFLKNQPVMSEEDRIKYEAERKELIGGGGEPNTALDMDGNVVYRETTYQPPDWAKVEEDIKNGKSPQIRIASGGGGPIPGTVAIKDGKYVPMQMEVDRMWLEYVKAGRTPAMYGAAKVVYSPPRFSSVAIFRNGKMRLGQMNTGTYECWFDVTNEEDVSRAILFMRKLNMSYFDFLKEFVPGFEDIYILNEATMAGSREGRRIKGGYTITYKDVENGSKFDDVIALAGPRGHGVHSVTGSWGNGTLGPPLTEPYEIPFRCLVPVDANNLLVAGRCVSMDHFALGAMRDMVTCMSLGEAAGVAAAVASKSGKTTKELDVKDVQNALRAQGAKLEFLPDDFN